MSDLPSVHLCVSHLRSSDTCASDAQLLGIRINTSNNMSSIQRLSSIIIDKDNAARGTSAGQCMVCLEARSASTSSSASSDNTEGDFIVFEGGPAYRYQSVMVARVPPI